MALQYFCARKFSTDVIDAASSRGIDIKKLFPFLVKGEITDYSWHVVTGQATR